MIYESNLTFENDCTFDEFIARLPAERQAPMRQVWELVQASVPAGYIESIGSRYLEFRADMELYVALTNKKDFMTLHLLPAYVMPVLQEQLLAAAPKLKLNRGCLNFKRAEDLPLEAIARVIAATPVMEYRLQTYAHRNAWREKG